MGQRLNLGIPDVLLDRMREAYPDQDLHRVIRNVLEHHLTGRCRLCGHPCRKPWPPQASQVHRRLWAEREAARGPH